MERSDSKNEKVWLGKVGRTDPKKREDLTPKWEDLTQKVGRADPKNGKVWFKNEQECLGKVGKNDPKKLEGLTWKS